MLTRQSINIRILLISNKEDDVIKIESHLEEFMRLPWSFMHCTNMSQAISRINKADIIVLDLDANKLPGPEENFGEINNIAFETPIIALTGENEEEHKLATYVMEKGAADIIIRGKFERLVDAIEFALIRQKISTKERHRQEKLLRKNQDQATEDQEFSRHKRIEEKIKNDQIISWLTGGYSINEEKK